MKHLAVVQAQCLPFGMADQMLRANQAAGKVACAVKLEIPAMAEIAPLRRGLGSVEIALHDNLPSGLQILASSDILLTS